MDPAKLFWACVAHVRPPQRVAARLWVSVLGLRPPLVSEERWKHAVQAGLETTPAGALKQAQHMAVAGAVQMGRNAFLLCGRTLMYVAVVNGKRVVSFTLAPSDLPSDLASAELAAPDPTETDVKHEAAHEVARRSLRMHLFGGLLWLYGFAAPVVVGRNDVLEVAASSSFTLRLAAEGPRGVSLRCVFPNGRVFPAPMIPVNHIEAATPVIALVEKLRTLMGMVPCVGDDGDDSKPGVSIAKPRWVDIGGVGPAAVSIDRSVGEVAVVNNGRIVLEFNQEGKCIARSRACAFLALNAGNAPARCACCTADLPKFWRMCSNSAQTQGVRAPVRHDLMTREEMRRRLAELKNEKIGLKRKANLAAKKEMRPPERTHVFDIELRNTAQNKELAQLLDEAMALLGDGAKYKPDATPGRQNMMRLLQEHHNKAKQLVAGRKMWDARVVKLCLALKARAKGKGEPVLKEPAVHVVRSGSRLRLGTPATCLKAMQTKYAEVKHRVEERDVPAWLHERRDLLASIAEMNAQLALPTGGKELRTFLQAQLATAMARSDALACKLRNSASPKTGVLHFEEMQVICGLYYDPEQHVLRGFDSSSLLPSELDSVATAWEKYFSLGDIELECPEDTRPSRSIAQEWAVRRNEGEPSDPQALHTLADVRGLVQKPADQPTQPRLRKLPYRSAVFVLLWQSLGIDFSFPIVVESAQVPGFSFSRVIMPCLELLAKAGFEPLALTYDTAHRELVRRFMARHDGASKVSFANPTTGSTIYTFVNPRSLLIRERDQLYRRQDLTLDHQPINWDMLRLARDCCGGEGGVATFKHIADEHLFLNIRTRTSTDLARETLTRSMAYALTICGAALRVCRGGGVVSAPSNWQAASEGDLREAFESVDAGEFTSVARLVAAISDAADAWDSTEHVQSADAPVFQAILRHHAFYLRWHNQIEAARAAVPSSKRRKIAVEGGSPPPPLPLPPFASSGATAGPAATTTSPASATSLANKAMATDSAPDIRGAAATTTSQTAAPEPRSPAKKAMATSGKAQAKSPRPAPAPPLPRSPGFIADALWEDIRLNTEALLLLISNHVGEGKRLASIVPRSLGLRTLQEMCAVAQERMSSLGALSFEQAVRGLEMVINSSLLDRLNQGAEKAEGLERTDRLERAQRACNLAADLKVGLERLGTLVRALGPPGGLPQ